MRDPVAPGLCQRLVFGHSNECVVVSHRSFMVHAVEHHFIRFFFWWCCGLNQGKYSTSELPLFSFKFICIFGQHHLSYTFCKYFLIVCGLSSHSHYCIFYRSFKFDLFTVLKIEPRVLCTLCKRSITERRLQPRNVQG